MFSLDKVPTLADINQFHEHIISGRYEEIKLKQAGLEWQRKYYELGKVIITNDGVKRVGLYVSEISNPNYETYDYKDLTANQCDRILAGISLINDPGKCKEQYVDYEIVKAWHGRLTALSDKLHGRTSGQLQDFKNNLQKKSEFKNAHHGRKPNVDWINFEE